MEAVGSGDFVDWNGALEDSRTVVFLFDLGIGAVLLSGALELDWWWFGAEEFDDVAVAFEYAEVVVPPGGWVGGSGFGGARGTVSINVFDLNKFTVIFEFCTFPHNDFYPFLSSVEFW